MRTPIVVGMLALLVVPSAASAAPSPAARNNPGAPAAPGSLIADTLRREQPPTRMAMARAGSVRTVGRAPGAETRKPVPVSPETRARIEKFYGIPVAPTATWLDVFSAGGNARVSLELENTPVREALKHIFDQVKVPYTVDADVPGEARVTVKARDVRFHTALNLITEAAGVGWTVEQKVARQADPLQRIAAAGAGTYRIGKSVQGGMALSRILLHRDGSVTAPALKFTDSLIPYAVWGREERSTFTCPHCKAQSTLVRVKNQPKCPKCERTYQPDWQFCPADGTKRPAPPAEWRFCPSCGKQVQPEKAQESGKLLGGLTPTLPETPAPLPAPPAADPGAIGAVPSGPETFQP